MTTAANARGEDLACRQKSLNVSSCIHLLEVREVGAGGLDPQLAPVAGSLRAVDISRLGHGFYATCFTARRNEHGPCTREHATRALARSRRLPQT